LRPDADRLAELEEERRFLLRSLADLEREHAAGDVDEVDYAELRDGYTVRAAATLREIEAGRAVLPTKPAADWRRRIVVLFGALALIGVVGWALAATNAQRLPGQTVTGADPRDERQLLLAQARAAQFQQPAMAAELYGQVLTEYPDDVEALTYRGWTTALSAADEAALRAALDDLARAIELDPTYPDPWCFRGIVTYRFLRQPELAADDLDQCLAFNPPADVRELIDGMLASPPASPATTIP
jgi:tetratricopeptide (TPR) repeat protein